MVIFIGGSHDHTSLPYDPHCDVLSLPLREPPRLIDPPDLSLPLITEHYLRTTFHCGHDGACNDSHYVTFYRHDSLTPADALQLLIDAYAKPASSFLYQPGV